ncbi:MAG TPA: hypothetical protein VI172_02785 [Candidatus Dormibacteraeota bacterium]|jgi:hypothetical protein
MNEHPNPAVADLNATVAQLQQRAAADYAAAQAAAQAKAAQGGSEQRAGILPGGGN